MTPTRDDLTLLFSNGGFSMALAEADGDCQILGEVATRDLDVDLLRTGLLDLAHKARAWRALVAFGADPSRAPPQPDQALDAALWG